MLPSANECFVTYFSLDPRETEGRFAPLTLRGQQLRLHLRPIILGVTLDDQLNFTAHIELLRSCMAKRRQCLQALAGKTYGSKRKTLWTEGRCIFYIRAIFDYGTAVFNNNAARPVWPNSENWVEK